MTRPTVDQWSKDRTLPTCRITHHFNEHEVRVLAEVCGATGEDLTHLSFTQANRYLALFYNVPHKARSTPDAYLAQIRLLELVASTLTRFEYQRFGQYPEAIAEACALLQRTIKQLHLTGYEVALPLSIREG